MQSALKKGVFGGLVAMAVLAGCAPTTPNLEATFGDAVNRAKAQQIVNPDASRNTNPVAGIDGQAANANMDRYHQVYESPTAAPSGSVSSGVGASGTTLK